MFRSHLHALQSIYGKKTECRKELKCGDWSHLSLSDSSHHISAPSYTQFFSHTYFVRHDEEISTSATHIIISLLEPTL